MTDYPFHKVAVYDQLGGVVRLARNSRIDVTDPATGLVAAGLKVAGVSVSFVTTDSRGTADFTSTLGTVDITAPNGLTERISSHVAVEAAVGAGISNDAAVAALLANPASASRVVSDGLYAPKTGSTVYATTAAVQAGYVPRPNLVGGLTTNFYIAHRGGAGFAPEETMEAFRTAIAAGADAIEMDVQPLGDGSLGVMHDTTVDRTTDGTGNVSTFTAPAWRALNAADAFPWNGRTVPPALLTEVLAEFAHKSVMMVEPKDVTNAGQIMDLFDSLALGQGVIIAASTLDVLQAATARGYTTYFWWGAAVGTGVSVATAVANGADFLGLDGVARPDAEVTTLVNTGLPVMPYTINRRYRKAQLAALGAVGYLSDQPLYIKQTTAQRTVDSWRQGVFGHGLNVNGSGSVNVPTIESSALVLSQAAVVTATPGEVLPLANAAGSYTIDLDLGFKTLPASGGSVCLYFGQPDDGNYHYSNAAGFGNGYLVLVRVTGVINLYRTTAGSTTATVLGSAATTAALTAGTFAHITVTVTPTQITVTRTDSAGTIGPVSDSTHRGGYLCMGKKDVADGVPHFKNLAIT